MTKRNPTTMHTRLPFVLLSIFFFVVLTAERCSSTKDTTQAMQDLSKTLAGEWKHSFEHDSGGIEAYRPVTYKFPPARGRKGFKLTADGGFTLLEIGPTDKINPITGTWKVEPASKDNNNAKNPILVVTLNSQPPRMIRYSVISYNTDMVRLQKLQ